MSIDIGPGASNYAFTGTSNITYIELTNPSNADGILTQVQFFFETDATGVVVGTITPSGALRSYYNVGDVVSGSVQTKDVCIRVKTGDYLGHYWATGGMSFTTSGGSSVLYSANNVLNSLPIVAPILSEYRFAIYATGVEMKNPSCYLSNTKNRLNTKGVSIYDQLA